MQTNRELSTYSYSVFNFVTDDVSGTTVPVGVALWSSSPARVRVRIADKERVKGLQASARPYIELVRRQVDQWIKNERLPYASEKVSPNTEQWWSHLSNLLVHRIRVSEPHAIACRNADEEIELLFEALVKPQRNNKERRGRIDRALTSSLGSLTRKFRRGSVPGFEGRDVPVKRYITDQHKLVVLEGVNLAAASAEMESDALVSRLQRIREANGHSNGKEVVALVGYLASPHGLNGEAVLVDWIKEKGGAQIFDLTRQREDFTSTVSVQVETLLDNATKQPFTR
jgi:hypothetical protein